MVEITRIVLFIIFGLFVGCGSQTVDPKNCSHKMATVENILTQSKFRNGDCVQVGGFAAPYPDNKWPIPNFYYFSSTKDRKKGPWILIYSEKKLPISKHIFVMGRWDITEDGSSLNVHGWFSPL